MATADQLHGTYPRCGHLAGLLFWYVATVQLEWVESWMPSTSWQRAIVWLDGCRGRWNFYHIYKIVNRSIMLKVLP
jgi:hypothetical protein